MTMTAAADAAGGFNPMSLKCLKFHELQQKLNKTTNNFMVPYKKKHTDNQTNSWSHGWMLPRCWKRVKKKKKRTAATNRKTRNDF